MSEIADYLQSRGVIVKSDSGGQVRCTCFFHAEDPGKRGRLYVASEGDNAGLFMCHRCGERGNLRTLRKHFGDPVDESPLPGERTLAVLDAASRYYEEHLDVDHLKYLRHERGFTMETIKKARFGFCPGGKGTMKRLIGEGFSYREIKDAGLMSNDSTDFLSGRITFPYMAAGYVVTLRGKQVGGKYASLPGSKTRLYNSDAALTTEDVVVTEGEMDCYSGDTEVLTRRGWVRFDEYSGGAVAQWSEDGAVEFVEPSAVVCKRVDRTLHLRTRRRGGLDIIVTPGHRMVATEPDGSRPFVHRADTPPPVRCHVPRVGYLDGPGLSYSDNELRLLVAISADSTIDVRKYDGRKYVRFGLSKQRKVDRLRWLLTDLDIEYSDQAVGGGVQSICFTVPCYLDAFKVFPWEWITLASLEQREMLLDELVLWDGNRVKNRDHVEYSSKEEVNAMWVQTLAHTAGHVATMMPRSNAHGNWWKVSVLQKTSSSWQQIDTEEAGPRDVFCVSVPSGLLMVRRENQVLISGNCLMLQQLGFKAVGVPGASSWQEPFNSYFEDAKRVWVLFDPDSAGVTGANKVATMLDKAKVLTLPVPEDVEASEVDVSWLVNTQGWTAENFSNLMEVTKREGSLLKSVDDTLGEYDLLRNSVGLRTGFEMLDNFIRPGVLPGQILIVLARTGDGKTQWVLNLMQRTSMAQPDARFLLFSLEQTAVEVWTRQMKIWSFYNLNVPAKRVLKEAADYWRPRLHFVDENRISISKFRATVEEYAETTGGMPSMIIVDYLGYWAMGFKGSSRYERLSDAIMELKALAKEYLVPIVVPHQVRRGSDAGTELELDDARDAGTIPETGDMVFSLWSPDSRKGKDMADFTGEVVLKIIKSRNGGKGMSVKLQRGPISLVLLGLEDPRHVLASNEYSLLRSMPNIEWADVLEQHRVGDAALSVNPLDR